MCFYFSGDWIRDIILESERLRLLVVEDGKRIDLLKEKLQFADSKNDKLIDEIDKYQQDIKVLLKDADFWKKKYENLNKIDKPFDNLLTKNG